MLLTYFDLDTFVIQLFRMFHFFYIEMITCQLLDDSIKELQQPIGCNPGNPNIDNGDTWHKDGPINNQLFDIPLICCQ